MKVSQRGGVAPFIVMDVLREANARAAAGEDILHLEVGQPGDPAPAVAREAAALAAREMRLGYTDALGLPSLRARIARSYAERYGCAVDDQRIAVAAGSSAAFMLAFLAAFDVGDRVALAAPGYPAYRNILTALGLEAVSMPTAAADGFQPTPEALERLDPRPNGVIVASPANPTGAMLTPEALAALCAWCDDNDVRLISDEIYHGVVFPGAPAAATAAALSEHAIVVNSVSKYHGMTGWRIGWAVAPRDLLRPMERLAQNLFIAPSAIGQVAAEAAFDAGAELDDRVARYARNGRLLGDALEGTGFRALTAPQGAFYLYCDVSDLTDDSRTLSARLLAEIGVAATPGLDFDAERGARTMRLSYCESEAVVAAAAMRLAAVR